MGHFLSSGIRVYEHAVDGELVGRTNYNWWQGMNEVDEILIDPALKIVAIGCEGGAMAVHYRWLH